MIYVISCNIQYISYISIYPNDLSTIPLLADPSTAFHKTSPIRPPIKRFRILCRFSWCLSLGRSNFYNSHFAGEKHVFFFNRSKYQQKYLPEGMMRISKHSTVTLHTILFQQSTFNVGMMPRTNYYRLGWTRHVLGCLHASPFSSQHCQAL